MPSRQPSISPPSAVVFDLYPPAPSPNQSRLPPFVASTTSFCSLLFLVLLCFRRKRTTPSSDSESKPPYRFSYPLLRRATSSFSTLLGHGGFGPVFSGTLPSTRQPIAVKLMDSASLQGEREFHNELFFASRLRSQYVTSAIGFSSDRKRRRYLLVYELMHSGNLQDALLRRKCPELLDWKKRFSVIVDIAKGIQYLHSCDPPVIHGDIKPSNILLDRNLSAKIGDLGLARLKSESHYEIGILGVDSVEKKNDGLEMEENKRKEEELESSSGSLLEETQSVTTGEQSPEGSVKIPISETSPETIEAAPASIMEANFDKVSIQSEKDISRGAKKNGKWLRSNSVKDWWWKHDNEGAIASSPAGENKKVKDYVVEWLGKEINKETPKNEWVAKADTSMEKAEKKRSKRRLEWWASMEEENNGKASKKKRPAREWWKEEYCKELEKKKKKKQHQQKRNGENSWIRNIDWWLDGISGEPFRARRNSYDSGSGEIVKSGGISISSTPSMRGTVCYVAPEYGYGDDVSEKCDVYSFGVLLLVIVSGRRPLQVTGSPLSEFHRANLLSWARRCARNGKLLDLVDQSIKSLDKEQALLCIHIALLCLLKTPRRPSMKEVVAMLSGELEPPQLPVEYSPSPTSRVPFKSRHAG